MTTRSAAARPPSAHWGAAALVGLAVLLRRFPESAFYPACPVSRWLHLRCPGCGATRALTMLLHGRIVEAWRWNQLFVAALPLLLVYLAIAYWRGEWPELPRPTIVGALGVAGAFAVARNLGGF